MAVVLSGQGDQQHVELESMRLNTLDGEVSGQVTVNWMTPLSWQADLGLQHIRPELYWPQAEGDISGRLRTSGKLFKSGGWHAELRDLDVEGVIREYPLTVQGMLIADQLITGASV